VDVLITSRGAQEFSAPYLRGAETHGTGCTFSAAIATGLARGHSLEESVAQAKKLITAAIRHRLRWKKTSALNHGARSW
jgi:hydroxymethylpyrimidine/phosphomethylpyrimidine kinase